MKPMKVGALSMPSHPPERGIGSGQRCDLEEIERLDRLGFDEAWIGEHFTVAWEPCPAPDLLITQALQRTERIHLGPLGQPACSTRSEPTLPGVAAGAIT
jgi:alkanesulfonate monooxygenase SsuD/methylene tetrahydromethanopterin reductase-like flavin-dependent oxidoreductase (luciferase family)